MIYLYVIGREEGPVKIGITIALRSRLSTIQTGCPFPIEILYWRILPNREIALDIEQCIHQVWEEKRLNGEWFDIDGDQGEEAVECAIDTDSYFRGGCVL